MPLARIVVGLLWGMSLVGCGSDNPFEYDQVDGRVTYDDGAPLPAANYKIRFASQDAPKIDGAFPRPGLANVDAQGVFECVTSYKYGDGLIPGRHKVAIEAPKGPGGKPIVPIEYSSIATTPLVIDTADSPLEIKVPKPATK